jgi:hypothetical protein
MPIVTAQMNPRRRSTLPQTDKKGALLTRTSSERYRSSMLADVQLAEGMHSTIREEFSLQNSDEEQMKVGGFKSRS